MKNSTKFLASATVAGGVILAGNMNMSAEKKYNQVITDIQSGVAKLVCGKIPTSPTYNNPHSGTLVTKNPDGTYTIAIAKPNRGKHSAKYEVINIDQGEADSKCKIILDSQVN